jgi:hypothetical protein
MQRVNAALTQPPFAHIQLSRMSEDAPSQANRDSSAGREISFPPGPTGKDQVRSNNYFKHFVLPIFYFHVTAAYAILRYCGGDVGERYFLGAIPMKMTRGGWGRRSLSLRCSRQIGTHLAKGLVHSALGKTMASDDKKAKAVPAPKKELTPKDKSTSGEDVSKAKSEETAATATAVPAGYSRGEGQKPVTRAYKENWNAIFAKKKNVKKKK